MTRPHSWLRVIASVAVAVAALTIVAWSQQTQLTQPANTWVKRSPLTDTPPSPRLGYEGACVWDGKHRVVIRYGGHNQGGGGEQHSEIWTFNPRSAAVATWLTTPRVNFTFSSAHSSAMTRTRGFTI